MTKYKVSGLDQIGYYLTVLITFGGAWVLKTIIAKAIADTLNTAESDEIKK